MIRIIILGSRKIRIRTGCCGSRSQEEIVKGYIPQLYRRFGQRRMECRYLDIDDEAAGPYEAIVGAVQKKEISLPVAVRDGQMLFHGQATLYMVADYIATCLKQEQDILSS